jgi:hypothetical protein
MKEIIETKFVEQKTVKYVADDGREFDNENDCRCYEMSQDREKIKLMYESLNPVTSGSTALDWFECGTAIDAVVSHNEREFGIIKAYFKSISFDVNLDEPNEYPHRHVIFSSENCASEPRFTIKQLHDDFIKLAKVLEEE